MASPSVRTRGSGDVHEVDNVPGPAPMVEQQASEEAAVIRIVGYRGTAWQDGEHAPVAIDAFSVGGTGHRQRLLGLRSEPLLPGVTVLVH